VPDAVQVGQLWEFRGQLFRVEDLNGGHQHYPIVLKEIARDSQLDAAVLASIAATPGALRAFRRLYPAPRMEVDRSWFLPALGAQRWLGSAETWTANLTCKHVVLKKSA